MFKRELKGTCDKAVIDTPPFCHLGTQKDRSKDALYEMIDAGVKPGSPFPGLEASTGNQLGVSQNRSWSPKVWPLF